MATRKEILEIIVDRLAKNGVITTFIGVVFLFAALFMFISKTYEMPYVLGAASIGLLLLGVKDDVFGKFIKK